jgi:hypothetical protein
VNAAGREFERAVGRAHFPTGTLLCALFMAYLIGHIVFAFLRGTLPIRQAPYGAELEKSVEPRSRVASTHGLADVRSHLGNFR